MKEMAAMVEEEVEEVVEVTRRWRRRWTTLPIEF